MSTQTETLTLEGMSCGHCVKAVQMALEDLDGVQVHEVAIGSARITYDPHETDMDEIAEVLDEEGYPIAERA